MGSHWVQRLRRSRPLWAALGLATLAASSAFAADWEAGAGHRSLALRVPATGRAGFHTVPPDASGLRFTNSIAESRHLTNQILLNGSGVAAGDVDGDGWCDLYFCALDQRDVLYRNLGGWKFEDVTTRAGLADVNLDSTGAAFGDLEGDGDLDLVVNSVGGGTRLYFNDGTGRFTASKIILNPGRCGTSLALGDLDGDGFLDLYVANYRTSALMDMPNTRIQFKTVAGRQVVWMVNGRYATEPDLTNRFVVNARGGVDERGEPDVLFRNVGGTNFLRIPFTGGAFLDEDGRPLAEPPFDWGLTVAFRDMNDDGRPDIYVCNDFDSPDRIWLNQGGWRFRALPRLALRKTSLFSMGLDFADINRDGFDDLFVLDMLTRDHARRMDTTPDRKAAPAAVGQFENRPQFSLNTLFLNRGDGTWAEISQLAGVAAAEWAWAAAFLDVDLDGFEDLLVTNGNERDARSMDVAEQLRLLRTTQRLSNEQILQNRRLFPRLDTPNLVFRNRGDLIFEDASDAWAFNLAGVSHGLALADLDNDGDLDVVVNNLNAAASAYRNESAAPRVAVRLKGRAPNTEGIGARLTLTGGAVPHQAQEMMAGGRYVADDQTMRVFAAGSLTNEMTIQVDWRGARRSVVHGVRANRLYEIEEPAATETKPENPRPPAPLFSDQSGRLNHVHADEPFDDHARQPTLPHRLSQLGPGVAWADLDGDGWDNLIIGGGRGGTMAVFQNDRQGGFRRRGDGVLQTPLARDQTAIVTWPDATGRPRVLAGSANWEDGETIGPVARQFDLAAGTVDDSLPGSEASTGPLALSDVEGDGDLDLFVGGRCVPGRHPVAAVSVLFRNERGQWQLDAENTTALAGAGRVSGAVFSDLDADGDAELVLATDWGPLKIFRNERGRFTEWSTPVATSSTTRTPLAALTGWWNSVTAGDFDGDGRMDLVAGNWGRNTRYEAGRGRPLTVFHGDFDEDGREEWIEMFHDGRLGRLVPVQRLDFLARALPFLRERFNSHRAWAAANGIGDILADRAGRAQHLEAAWLESTVLLNRGDHFEARPLPVEAQMAPAFGLAVADFDGDGHEDVFLAQNFFATLPETPRYDGGTGLLLRGDGRGGFHAVPPGESGLKVYGEQRGAAVGDFDADGRPDLVVAQNGAATRLFRNERGTPGQRVRLKGPAANPAGIGAVLQAMAGDKPVGPAREIHAGSGYWSQDSATTVMPATREVTRLRVRWPGGRTTEVTVPTGGREIVVPAEGR